MGGQRYITLKIKGFEEHTASFAFIGAGGNTLPLLQKTGIPESKHLAGFPISGQFLVCDNPEVVQQHHSKVYGKEPSRYPANGPFRTWTAAILKRKDPLLYGPFAGFTPKFLKTGSRKDLFGSMKPTNILTMLAAGAKNTSLLKYLAQQLTMSKEDRMQELRNFVPNASSEAWKLIVAGKRVQLLEDTDEGGLGAVQFGTKLIRAEDRSMAALIRRIAGCFRFRFDYA